MLSRHLRHLSATRWATCVFYWATEDEAGAWGKAVSGMPDAPLMAARVRAMWHAIRQQAAVREACKSRVEVSDLDDMLDDTALAYIKQFFLEAP